MGPKDAYLVLYNVACCLGWSAVAALSIPSVLSSFTTGDLSNVNNALASVYGLDGVAPILFWVQTAALLEIIHAAIGFVRSPVI
eukprot:6421185-Ditylum_brightwellii.AAC.1